MDAPLGVWSIIVEFTVPVTEEDIRVRHEGDAEHDFADRGIERLTPSLNAMTDGGKTMGWLVMPQLPTGEVKPLRDHRTVWARRCSA